MKDIYINGKKNIGTYVKKLFLSDNVELFFFSVICTTTFVSSMLHWWLDIYQRPKAIANIHINDGFDFRTVFFIEIIVVLFYLIRSLFYKEKYKFDFALIILIFTNTLIGVLDYHKENYLNVQYAWLLPFAYIVGKVVVKSNDINYKICKLFFSLAFGMFLAGAFDFYSNMRLSKIYGSISTEYWASFWLWSCEESRCTYELGFVLITASSCYLLYKAHRNYIVAALIIFINIFIQYCDVIVEGRENRLLLPICVIIFGLLLLYDSWDKFSPNNKKNIIRIAIIACILSVFVCVAFFLNILGLHDAYLASNWSAGGGIITNERFKIDYEAFKLMLQYPTENYADYTNVYSYYYQSHSMLLEYGRNNNITVYVLLVLFRLIAIKDAFALAVSKREDSWVKYFLIPGFISINIYYSLEPNGFAHRYFWMAGLLVSGMIRAWTENKHNEGISFSQS